MGSVLVRSLQDLHSSPNIEAKRYQMKIVAISDLHGKLPDNVPECDLLLIGGDICPDYRKNKEMEQLKWYEKDFKHWLDAQKAGNVVLTWGNHDWVGQFAPENRWASKSTSANVLVDEETTVNGLRIWGSPWQPRFYDWAFNLDEPELEKKWELIPEGIDILLLHGPPHGYGDLAPSYGRSKEPAIHVGSPSLAKAIERVRPRLVVCGHIHPGYGSYTMGCGTIVLNASMVNERYEMVNNPHVFEW